MAGSKGFTGNRNAAYGNSNNFFDEPSASNKQLVKENLAPKKLSHLQFGLLSADEIQRLAEFQVSSSDLFKMPSRIPAHGGCLDPRLGISDKLSTCQTCNCKLVDCAGHFGYIKLALPVFHIGFFKHILSILQCICKTCSRVLLDDELRQYYLLRMRNSQNNDVVARGNIFKKVLEICKKKRSCPYCGRANGTVKKISGVSTLKIVHEKYGKASSTAAKNKSASSDDLLQDLIANLEDAMTLNRELYTLTTSTSNPPVEDLLPTRVVELFRQITDDDCEILWVNPLIGGRPENLILQNLLVPPVPIRPSVAMDVGGGSNEDDLTVKLQEILTLNAALEKTIRTGAHTRDVMEAWDFVQVQVAQYINGEMPGLARPMGTKPMRGLCQRLKGKQGRFRGNLSGKRVDFSARTVISPDPNLCVSQVGVPKHVAKTMTYPERVSRYNIEKLRERVRNGPDVHPGANLIRMSGENGFNKSLAFVDRKQAAASLRVGDVVERHMEDDDVVLFNRQPSLHRLSIMSHRVKVMDWRTFRFNICVCAPYNADFDGDEMNMHLPQTEEARAEASLLMGVHHNLITPRNGEPLVAASQDFLSVSYLVTQRDQFFTREKFCTFAAYFSSATEHIDLPPPAIIKPVPLWTGKQLFSLMIRPNRQSNVLVNFEMKEKNYDSTLSKKHFCPKDGWVAFRNSELISGNIAKKTIGDGSKTGLLYVLLRDCGEMEAARLMDRFAKFCSRYMGGHRGYSIGISDVTPSDELLALKKEILQGGYEKCSDYIDQYEKGELELRPGCNLQQSLEENLNGTLGKLRESAGAEANRVLGWSNTPRIMAESGAKGSVLNISQMIACVGQQNVGGKRIQDGFVNRTLPHFEYHSFTPSARGFVANSFYSGLTATEFFFHTMGGREGLVDTAVKTAETGYMARRLMKALEDLSQQYDSTVRNSENTVVQFTYGDDSLNPEKMENNGRPVDFDRIRLHISQTHPSPDESSLRPPELEKFVEKRLKEKRFQDLLPEGRMFHEEIINYFKSTAKKQEELLSNPQMPQESFESVSWNSCRLTKTQAEILFDALYTKYTSSFVEPGEAIGATGAQSISEPGTQMTLKTFHFAGVASMNVTLGVPRLKEIINASKSISTPIITVRLQQDDNKVAARIVKAALEKTTLGEISSCIKEVYAPGKCYISIKLDMSIIEQLNFDIDSYSVRNAILHGVRGQTKPAILRILKDSHVKVKAGSNSKLRVYAPHPSETKASTIPPTQYFIMQSLKLALPSVIVQGIPTVNRAVINEERKDGRTSYHLLVEGCGLSEIMGASGVDGRNTTTNNIDEVEKTLGVEAARERISFEITYIMNAYGIGIDSRHLLLLSDVMTFKGEVLGITRFGVSKMRSSVLMLASFEKTTDHLFDAAAHGRTDAIVGVSECIIMGIPMPLGTGLFKLLKKATAPAKRVKPKAASRPLLLS